MLVAVVAAVPYLNTLGNEFAFDDVIVVRDHPMITGTESPWRLLGWVQNPGAYRPLTMLSYAANARVDDSPRAFHLVNVVLHVIVTLELFALAGVLLRSVFAATLAALVFAVHPIHTEAVAAIVGRAELLSSALVLAALLFFILANRAAGGRQLAWMAGSILTFVLAPFAKESAFAALPLFAVTYAWLTPNWRWRKAIGLLGLYAAAGAVYLAVRAPIVGALTMPSPPSLLDNPLAYCDPATRIRTAVIVLWQYLSSLAVPVHLSADYSFNQIPLAFSAADPRFLVALGALAACGFIVAVAARRAHALLIAAAFLIVPLALTTNILFPIGTIKAERLLYLPSVGWCLAIGALAMGGMQTGGRRWLTMALLVLVLGAYAARSWDRNRDWKDNATLFAATVAESPASAKSFHNVGTTLQQNGRLDEAMTAYRQALEIYPEYAEAACGVGHIHQLQGHDGLAMYWYLRALATEPDYAKAHLFIATIRQQRGEYDAAEAAVRTGLASTPADPLLAIQLSATLLAQGDRWRAGNVLRYAEHLSTAGDPATEEAVHYARRELGVAVR